MNNAAKYVGRFAPSPTGDLHFGSLVAAVASYLDAKHHGGEWLVRMEDVDGPRCSPASADGILRTLEAHGFCWDRAVLWQSQRSDFYSEALDRLQGQGEVYGCACTRKEVGEGPYAGTCRHGLQGRPARAWRVKVRDEEISWQDHVQGECSFNLAEDCGDFVLLRADGIWAYQLAVVVDDAAQGVTHVVRGADLLDSTPRQIHLQRLLNYAKVTYLHIPAVVDDAGQKLSKQTGARALDAGRAVENLNLALRFLGQEPPRLLVSASPEEVWSWARENWDRAKIPRAAFRPMPDKHSG
jgi:glutamyl-Q tRNA(Asp) synthetase